MLGVVPASVNAVHPRAPAYSNELATHCMQVMEATFPSLAPSVATHTNTHISTTIGVLDILFTQNRKYHKVKLTTTTAKETKTATR